MDSTRTLQYGSLRGNDGFKGEQLAKRGEADLTLLCSPSPLAEMERGKGATTLRFGEPRAEPGRGKPH